MTTVLISNALIRIFFLTSSFVPLVSPFVPLVPFAVVSVMLTIK